MKLKCLAMACAVSASFSIGAPSYAGSGEVVLIQSGDIHGHLVPRANVRSDSTGHMEGGLARMATVIQQIREANLGKTIYINTGDTVQGSAEALFTRGQALIDVVNMLGVEFHAPGNWDFLYGAARFEETFKGTSTTAPLANWNARAANLYYTNQYDDTAVCAVTGTDPATSTVRPFKRVLPPYMVKTVNGVKVGILGFTTARAIAAISPTVTANYQFTDGKTELPCYINVLRNTEHVDVVVLASELEMARDIALANTYPGVDVILNSDMHEKTIAPIVSSLGTVIVEEGQDGTMLGEMHLNVSAGHTTPGDGKLTWTWTPHIITDVIRENRFVAAKVKQVRTPFVSGTFVAGQQVAVGGNTTTLMRPIDEVIAYTNVALHRSNFMDEDMPGVVEGTSHDLIADAMAAIGSAQSASIRGFRYGTHIAAGGAITMQDIYHYIPIAAKLGRTNKACGADLKFAIENSIGATFHSDPTQWGGGWMFGYSGLNYDLDACSGFTGATPVNPTQLTSAVIGTTNRMRPWTTARGTNIKVNGVAIDEFDVYDARTTSATYQQCLAGDGSDTPHNGYTVTGYWYAEDPTTINNCAPCRGRTIQVVKTDGSIVQVAGPGVNVTPASTDVMDVSEAVVQYLKVNLGGMVTPSNLPIHRLAVKRLPNINPFGFKTIQPLLGASAATCPTTVLP
jgi:sulfur-oxidizing protein SoxB